MKTDFKAWRDEALKRAREAEQRESASRAREAREARQWFAAQDRVAFVQGLLDAA